MDRNGAIETLKAFLENSDNAIVKDAILELHPELAESKDERIRKAIVSIVKGIIGADSCYFSDNAVSKNEVLAYLERQKERKPIINFPVFIEEKYIEQAIKKFLGESAKFQKEQTFTHHEIDESLQDAVTHQMEDDGDVDDFVRRGIDDIALKYAEIGAKWQKEQKPADDEVKAIAYREYERGRESGLRDGQKHVLDNAESYGLCKPAEWSEEEIVNWLKENFYVSSFDNTKIVTKFSSMDDLIKGFHKRFKSLLSRPKPSGNWKPSKYMLSLVKKVADGEMLTGAEQMAMGTLHEQLKKLSI